jgi:hypothetical protein
MPERGDVHDQAVAAMQTERDRVRVESEAARAAAMERDRLARETAMAADASAHEAAQQGSEAGAARARAESEAGRLAAGGPPDTSRSNPSRPKIEEGFFKKLDKGAARTIKGAAVGGVVGGAILGRVAEFTGLNRLWDGVVDTFEEWDVWDLSGRKAAAKSSKKK